MAVILTHTSRIAYYLPVLLISGMVTGLLMGVCAKMVIERINKIEKKNKKK